MRHLDSWLVSNMRGQKMDKKSLGPVGGPNAFVWLYCELQSRGKTLIRQGWRDGLPIDRPPIWVFCPLLRGNFPKDRVLIEKCGECRHYKGVGRRVEWISKDADGLKPSTILKRNRRRKVSFTKADFEKESRYKEELDRKWEEEERRLRRGARTRDGQI